MVLDVGMPMLDGVTVCRRLRRAGLVDAHPGSGPDHRDGNDGETERSSGWQDPG
ncbi:MAG: hypothetical protein ACRDQF_10965 [Thermocrispum sp.]